MKWCFESADAAAAYSARSEMLAYLRSRACDDSDFEGAAIIFGELVGNVVRHAPGAIAIELSWVTGVAVLRVADRGPGCLWNGTSLPDVAAESGRGLYIVSVLAQGLEVRPGAERGTEVTARLPVRLHARFEGA